MFDIKDKVVLITGAAGGIGASVVRNLLEKDIKHVTILDIDDKNGFAIEEELSTKYGSNKVKFIKCDITQEHELLNAFKTVKYEQSYIDIVINNAGIGSDKMFIKEIEVNLTALIRSSLQAWDLMRLDVGGRGGAVINVASVTALKSFPVVPVYSATKIATVKFSTALGDESHYSRTGVRVLTICFGVTDTQMVSKEKIGSFDPIIEKSMLTAFEPLKCQTPEEAAHGLIEVYKNGKSGSVWVVTSGKPAIDITETYVQTTEMFNDIILN